MDDCPMTGFDAFLSYNTEDHVIVTDLAHALEELGLRLWFDRALLPPGTTWQREIGIGVGNSCATLVCIGLKGLGKWQLVEMEISLNKQVEGKHRVIPVLLPGVDIDAVQLPPILKRNTWTIFGELGVSDRSTLERLYWGITGTRLPSAPSTVATMPELRSIPVNQDAINNLGDTLRADNVTYIIGSAATNRDATLLPTSFEISRDLLFDLRLIDKDYSQLLPTPDIVSSYFAVRSGATRLEDKVVEMIASRAIGVPNAYRRLAKLIELLGTRSKPRIRGRVQQLIVTTNIDTMIERALLLQGISFTRLVQHTSAPRIDINKYPNLIRSANGSIQIIKSDGPQTMIGAQDWDALDEFISSSGKIVIDDSVSGAGTVHALPLREISGDGPILYKFRGSQDIRGSCALSVDQYLKYVLRLFRQTHVPAQITEILNISPLLLLGYSYFDPDFRLIYHGLLRHVLELRQDPVYSVQLAPDQEQSNPYRKMELRLWDRVKESALRDWRITTLESSSEDFLQVLVDSLPVNQ